MVTIVRAMWDHSMADTVRNFFSIFPAIYNGVPIRETAGDEGGGKLLVGGHVRNFRGVTSVN